MQTFSRNEGWLLILYQAFLERLSSQLNEVYSVAFPQLQYGHLIFVSAFCFEMWYCKTLILFRWFHIPMFDKLLQVELTILASLGWEFSKLFTKVKSPFKDSLRSCGFFSSRIASWIETSVKPAMLWASSASVLERWETSVLKVESRSSNSSFLHLKRWPFWSSLQFG